MGRADDIAKLFQGLGASTDTYLEMESSFDYQEAPVTPLRAVVVPVRASSETQGAEPLLLTPETVRPELDPSSSPLQALLAEVAQAREAEVLARKNEALQQSLLKGAPPPIAAQVIVVVSAKGGVGKSTLCAALASTLALPDGRRIAIELDAQNSLRHHLQVSPDVAGLAQGCLRGENWNDLLLSGSGGTQVLPFGSLSATERSQLDQYLDHDSHWLARQIARMPLTAQDVLVLDVASGPSRFLDQALAVASQVLVVIDTEASGYLTLDTLQQWLAPLAQRRVPVHCDYVINRFDDSRAFSGDMYEVLRRRLGERLLGRVRLDYAIAEALAYGINPLQTEQPTPGVQDLLELVHRLKPQLLQNNAHESYRS